MASSFLTASRSTCRARPVWSLAIQERNGRRASRCSTSLSRATASSATGLRAVALVADVRAVGSDAIRVEIEHREGQAMFVLMPYKRRRLKRGVDYGDLTAGAGHPQIWSA